MKTRVYCFGLLFLVLTGLNGQEFGLQFYSLRNEFKKDVAGTLQLIKDWGITEIEGGENYGIPLEEFKHMLAENNLNVVSVGAGYKELEKDPEKAIKRAKNYGATYVMCPWIPHKKEFTLADAEKATALFNKVGKLMAENDLIFTYHPHGYEFRPHGEGTLFDVMAEGAENFAFEMDVYWVKHGGADPMTVLNTYPDKFVLMHLKDMKEGVEGNYTGHEDVETSVALGSGTVDIAGLVKRGRELGIKYMFIEDESSKVVSQVPQSLEFLKNIK